MNNIRLFTTVLVLSMSALPQYLGAWDLVPPPQPAEPAVVQEVMDALAKDLPSIDVWKVFRIPISTDLLLMLSRPRLLANKRCYYYEYWLNRSSIDEERVTWKADSDSFLMTERLVFVQLNRHVDGTETCDSLDPFEDFVAVFPLVETQVLDRLLSEISSLLMVAKAQDWGLDERGAAALLTLSARDLHQVGVEKAEYDGLPRLVFKLNFGNDKAGAAVYLHVESAELGFVPVGVTVHR